MKLIRGGLVKTMAYGDIEDGQILIDGNKIAAVGKELTVPENTEVIDATGCIVTPGLIDAHTHIGLHEYAIRWEGNDVNESSKPLTPDMRAIDGINPRDEQFEDALAAGVTTAAIGPGSANVVGGTFCALKLYGQYVDDMVIKDPVAMKCAFGENPKGAHGQKGRSPVTRMSVAALLRGLLMKSKRYLDEIAESEKDKTKKRPYDPELEAMVPVMKREIPLKVHAHRADDMLTAIRVAREFDVKMTLDHCTEGHLIVDRLSASHYPVLCGPSFGGKSKFELKDKTFATPGILNKAGLTVCIITDAPVTPLNYLPLCAGLAVKAGMDEESAWKAITINPARVIGVEKRIGSLEPGKDADIVVFDSNPLHDIQYHAKFVLVNGEIVMK